MLIVQKFGGSSVADAARIAHVADTVAETYRAGDRVVVVLSAQGNTTDELIRRAREIDPAPDARELDALLSTGELVSAALMAMELHRRGLPAVSLSGWQIGLHTDSAHGNALLSSVDTDRLNAELSRGSIVVAAGFQGIDGHGDVTTLGRGGSDTTAVALAAALRADRCRIYTDVDGVYTADPRRIDGARKLDAVPYDEMLALAALGSQVLHDRSVELAMRQGVELEVLSSLKSVPGTRVGRAEPHPLTGVTKDGERVSLVGAGLTDAAAERLTDALYRRGIPVRAMSRGAMSLTAIVPEREANAAVEAIHKEFF